MGAINKSVIDCNVSRAFYVKLFLMQRAGSQEWNKSNDNLD